MNTRIFVLYASAFLSFLLLVESGLTAQPYTRSFQLSGSGVRASTGKLLSDGNLLIAGESSTVVQDHSLFFLKVNTTTGDTLWSRSFSATGWLLSDLSADELSNGDIVATCTLVDSASIIDTPKILLLSISSIGNLNWSHYYLYPIAYPMFNAPMLKRISALEFLVCSTTLDTLGAVITKLNAAGDTLFSKALFIDSLFTTNDFRITDVVNVTDGYIFTGNTRFNEFENHLLLFKTDTNGNLLWVKSDGVPTPFLGLGYSILGEQIFMTSDSSLVIGTTSSSGVGLVKMNRTGAVMWAKFANDTTFYNSFPSYGYMAPANDGGYYLAGISDGPSQNAGSFTSLGRQLIFKFDSTGNVNWARTYLFEKNFNNCAFISQLPSGELITAGTIFDTIVSTNMNTAKLYAMLMDSAGHSGGYGCGKDSAYFYYPSTLSPVLVSTSHNYYGGYGFAPFSLSQSGETLTPSNVSVIKSVSLFESPTSSICEGTPIFFSAVTSNADTGAIYTFLVDGFFLQSGPSPLYSTNALSFPDTIVCVLTSGSMCGTPDSAISNILVPPIFPNVPPGVTVHASPGVSVASGTSVTFSVTVTNPGPAPTYLWKKNGVGVGSFPTYTTSTLVTGDIISCTVTNSSSCSTTPSTTGEVTMFVIPVGVAQLENTSTVQIVPNPAHDEATLTGYKPTEGRVVIKDFLGRVVLQASGTSTNARLNIRGLLPGLYLVALYTDTTIEYCRLVVE